MTSRRRAWAGLVTGGVLVVAALVLAHVTRFDAPTDAGRVPSSRGPGSSTSVASAPSAASGVPLRLRIPDLHVDAAVQPVVVAADRSLGVPDDPAVVGWWRDGARPGSAAGTVVIDGHVDAARTGPGALFHLADLGPGARVTVLTRGAEVRYVVVARHVYDKGLLPPAVFDQGTGPRLAVITCGGPFDRRTGHYRDNVVVFAVPARPR